MSVGLFGSYVDVCREGCFEEVVLLEFDFFMEGFLGKSKG